jgi:hypothetical protein
MLDKNNPLQMEMLEAGYTELEICEYFRDLHYRSEGLSPVPEEKDEPELTKVRERIDSFHKREYEKYCKMIKELKEKGDANCEGGENDK